MAQADYVSNAVRALITGATQNHPPTRSGRRTPNLSPPWRRTRHGRSRSTPTPSTLKTAPIT